MIKLIIALICYFTIFSDKRMKTQSEKNSETLLIIMFSICFLGAFIIENFFAPVVILILLLIATLCIWNDKSKIKNNPSINSNNTTQDNIQDNVQILQWVLQKDLSTVKQYLGEPDYTEKIGKSTWKLTYSKYDICINHRTGIVTKIYSNSKPD